MSRRSAEYRRRIARVREIVNRHDPIGLIAMGCPEDEYDQEVQLVLIAMSNATGEADLCEKIQGVFVEAFTACNAGLFHAWKQLGAELWELCATDAKE